MEPAGTVVGKRLKGHLFVTRGDLLKLACDAILIPSGLDERGERGHVGAAWKNAGGSGGTGDLSAAIRSSADRVACARSGNKSGPSLWVGHTGEAGRPSSWYADAARQFVRQAATATLAARPLGDDRPMIVR